MSVSDQVAVTPTPASPDVIERLVAGHREFLAFLQTRVPDKEVAEELLLNALVRALEKGGTIEQSESSVAWFYRMLRNALIDYYRRSASQTTNLKKYAQESEHAVEPELHGAICRCVNALLPTLKPEYAEIIKRVDLEDISLDKVAHELNTSVNNATVRLHRARRALRQQLELSCGTCATHGCLDCGCMREA